MAIVQVLTLVFFIFSMLSPLTVRTTFAQDAVVEGEQTVVVEPAAEEPVAPVEEPVVPAEEPAAPVEEPVVAEEPAAPVEEPAAPVVEPVVEEPAVVEQAAAEVPAADETSSVDVAVDPVEEIVTDPGAVSCVASNATAPWIASDLADYPPGALVTLTGAGWVPGQTVEIFVDDDGVADAQMGAWSISTTVDADASGAIFFQFNLPAWFVADYFVTATGECSTATTTFTDGNVQIAIGGVTGVTPLPQVAYRLFKQSNCVAADFDSASNVAVGTNVTTKNNASIEFTAPTIPGWTFQSWNLGTVSGDRTCLNGAQTLQVATATYARDIQPTKLSLGNLVHTYDGTSKSATVTTDPAGISGVTITYKDGTGNPVAQPINAGSYMVTASLSSTTYKADSVTGTMTIAPRAISVAADAQTMTFGGAEPELTHKITSGSLVGTDAIAGNLSRAVGTNVGTYDITQGTLSAGPNYTLTYAGAKLTIKPAASPLVVTDAAVVYDGAEKSVEITGVPSGMEDKVIVTYNGGVDLPVNAGTYAVEASLDSSNYTGSAKGTLVIEKAEASISVSNISRTYTGDVLGANVSVDPDVPGLAVLYANEAGNEVEPINVGTYTLTATLDNPNYAAEKVENSFAIIHATSTVTDVIATDSIYEGKTMVSATVSVAGSVTFTVGETSFGPVETDGGAVSLEVTHGQAAGEHVVTASFTPANANYEGSSANGTLVVDKAPVALTLDNLEHVYSGAPASATVEGAPDGVNVTVTYNGASDLPVNAGTYEVVATADSPNHKGEATGTLTIATKPITVTVLDASKVYGADDPEFRLDVPEDSLIGEDRISVEYDREEGANVGTYKITAAVKATDNYNVTVVPGTLKITPLEITVTADPQTKVYGESDPGLTYKQSTDLVEGDAFTGKLARDEGENAGSYAIRQGTLALNDNYDLMFEGAELQITKRPITVRAKDQTKVYNTADPALTHEITEGTLAFKDTISGDLKRIAGDNVGTYAIQQGTVALGDNYDLTFVDGALKITQAEATITLGDLKQTWDGQPKPVKATTNPAGIQVVTVTYSGSMTVPTDSGTYAVVAKLDNPNYKAAEVHETLTITAKVEIRGFYQPVDMNGVVNTVRGGSTVPLKFEVFVNGKEVRDIQTVKISIKVVNVACDSKAPSDEIELTATGGTSLRYDTAGDQFVYNWQTPKAAGSCYGVSVSVASGNVTVDTSSTPNAIIKTK